jgi:predicted flavoprotein YhiN
MIDPEPPKRGLMPTHRVVIIGASTTGLFAAASAAGSGRTVMVIDRDDLPPEPGSLFRVSGAGALCAGKV